MDAFGFALSYALRHEGGWSDDPLDPGGATMHGITLATAQRHGVATKGALRAIAMEKVAEIYLADYWSFDGLRDWRVAAKLFDMAVNMGPAAAVRYLQKILNVYGAGLKADGIFGPATCGAANRRDPDLLLELLCGISAEHYSTLAKKRPALAKFLNGWLKRAGAVPTPAP